MVSLSVVIKIEEFAGMYFQEEVITFPFSVMSNVPSVLKMNNCLTPSSLNTSHDFPHNAPFTSNFSLNDFKRAGREKINVFIGVSVEVVVHSAVKQGLGFLDCLFDAIFLLLYCLYLFGEGLLKSKRRNNRSVSRDCLL